MKILLNDKFLKIIYKRFVLFYVSQKHLHFRRWMYKVLGVIFYLLLVAVDF